MPINNKTQPWLPSCQKNIQTVPKLDSIQLTLYSRGIYSILTESTWQQRSHSNAMKGEQNTGEVEAKQSTQRESALSGRKVAERPKCKTGTRRTTADGAS